LPRLNSVVPVLVLLLALSSGVLLGQAFDDIGYEKAIATIKCDCGCHPQSLKDCACGYAAEKRDSVREMMTADASGGGMSGDAVIAKFIAEFGEQIRISPPARGFNLVVWLGPLIVLALSLPAMIMLLRRWKAMHPVPAPSDIPVMPTEADSAYLGRVQKQLEEME
jgi:cytochrome c-type biogenesis protein CcmH